MTISGAMLGVLLAVALVADDKSPVVAKVNGAPITRGDLEFAASQQGISAEQLAAAEPKLMDQLVDRQLIRAFLAGKKIEPVATELEFQITKVEDIIRKRGEDPAELLARIGYTPERLKSELGLPIAWLVYARSTIKPEQIKSYFEAHRPELDGTRLRGRQIFLKRDGEATAAATAAREQKLKSLRAEILAGKISFADAAKQTSEAPSRETGGDVGLFGWHGSLPPAVSQAAFSLKVDEISQPVVTPLGVHLIQVTERHPGDLSLEDVRPVIIERLSQELWVETVKKLRSTAKIERIRAD